MLAFAQRPGLFPKSTTGFQMRGLASAGASKSILTDGVAAGGGVSFFVGGGAGGGMSSVFALMTGARRLLLRFDGVADDSGDGSGATLLFCGLLWLALVATPSPGIGEASASAS